MRRRAGEMKVGGMLRHLFASVALGATLVAAYGCSGFSDDQAKERCQAEQDGRAACFDTKSFESCVSCFESCGDDCVATGACPTRYVCPDEGNAGQAE